MRHLCFAGWCYVYFKPNSESSISTIDALTYEAWFWSSIILVLICTTIYTITVGFRRRKVSTKLAKRVNSLAISYVNTRPQTYFIPPEINVTCTITTYSARISTQIVLKYAI